MRRWFSEVPIDERPGIGHDLLNMSRGNKEWRTALGKRLSEWESGGDLKLTEVKLVTLVQIAHRWSDADMIRQAGADAQGFAQLVAVINDIRMQLAELIYLPATLKRLRRMMSCGIIVRFHRMFRKEVGLKNYSITYQVLKLADRGECPMTNRRKFLAQCGAVITVTALAPRALLAQSLRRVETLSQQNIRGKDDFTAMLGRSFYLHDASAENQAQVKLVRVLNYPSSPDLEQFGVFFRGRAATRLPDGLYTASGWESAPFPIYIKRVAGNRRRQLYLADFSLLQ